MAGESKCILIVDDKEENLYYLRALLQGYGHQVTEARHGAEALREARRSAPDVVVSDILMPVMDGFALCREWKADATLCDIPFIVYTATYTDAKDEQLALHLGADAYIRKPAEPELFMACLKEVFHAVKQDRHAVPQTAPLSDEEELQEYNAALVRKLEHKTARLEESNRALEADITARELVERQLRGSEARFRELAENIREVFWMTDVTKQSMLYISPGYEDIWGRSCESLYAAPRTWLDAIHPDDRQRVVEAATTRQTDGSYDEEYRILRPNGDMRWIHDRAFPVRDDNGDVVRIVGIADDITERRNQELKIQRLSRVKAVLSGINGLIVRERSREVLFREACRLAVEDGGFALVWIGEVGADGRIRMMASGGGDEEQVAMVNAALAPSPSREELPTLKMVRERRTVICNDIATDPLTADWRDVAAERGLRSMIALPLLIDGRAVGCLNLFSGEVGFFDDEEITLLEELTGDIAYALEFIVHREEANYLAHYDPLTGLANRKLFLDRVNERLEDQRPDHPMAVGLIDIDNFRSVNSTYGPGGGEEVLKTVAGRLTQALGGPEYLARIVPDRFAVIIPDLGRAISLAPKIRDRLITRLGRPMRIRGQELRLRGKVGIAQFPNDGKDAEVLLGKAEVALKKAKLSGERTVFYNQEIGHTISERLEMETQMLRALERDEFLLHYQPKVDLRDGTICGAEALIRWQSEAQGLVSPARFLPVLEESGMIVEVGRWVIQQAIRDLRRWREMGLQSPRVAVNVSQQQLRQPDFVEVVRAEVAPRGKAVEDIDLEVTESMLIDDIESGIERLRALRELGLDIALDDFGTGYSSLAYLARLPFTAVKVDRSFIEGMSKNAEDLAIVTAIITLAQGMNLKVIAEGVETEEQLKYLRLLRCNQMQGYLFSKPLPADDFAALLREGRRLGG